MFLNYFKIAIRNLRRFKSYTFINVFGLASAITVCLFILIYVQHETSYDSFNKQADRIVRTYLSEPDASIALTPSALGPTVTRQLPEVRSWLRIYIPTHYNPAIVRYNDKMFEEHHFYYADSTFFNFFSFSLVKGNPEKVLDRPNTIVLTQEKASKYFGNKNPIGKTLNITVNSTDREFEVTGVIKEIPANSHLNFDFIAPMTTIKGWSQLVDNQIQAANFYTYLLLNHKGNNQLVESKINELVHNMSSDYLDITIGLQPLTRIHLHSDLQYDLGGMGDIRYVYAFSAIGILILIIACINYMNLATARSARRAPEIGIRKVLGAHKRQLVGQFYGESVVVVLISAMIAAGMSEALLPVYNSITGMHVASGFLISPLILGALAILIIIISIIAGSYPALMLSSFKPAIVLKGTFSQKGNDATLRKVLVVFQFAVSVFLIIGSLTIYRQVQFIRDKKLGFDKDHVIVLPIGDEQLMAHYNTLKQQLLSQSGISKVTGVSNLPGDGLGGYKASAEGVSEAQWQIVNGGAADPDILSTLNIQLLAGKGFTENPGYSTQQGFQYLINKKLADDYGWRPEQAVGKKFNLLGGRQGRVVGVMQNFNYASLKENIEPLAFFLKPGSYDYMLVKISAGDIPGALASIKKVWQKMAPQRPFAYNFLDQNLDAMYASEMRMSGIFNSFTLFAILIACLGLVGLASYMVERRTKEIGVRKILGASIANVINLLAKDFLWLILFAFLIAVPISYYIMNQWLMDYAYRITLTGLEFLLACGIVLLIAACTVGFQSLRGAVRNPVESLRSD